MTAVAMARLARIGTRGADERWFLLGELHWHALAMLSQVAQKPVQGLQQGGRHLRLKPKTQRKLRELDAAWGILRHLTLQKSEDFLAQLAAELELERGRRAKGGHKRMAGMKSSRAWRGHKREVWGGWEMTWKVEDDLPDMEDDLEILPN